MSTTEFFPAYAYRLVVCYVSVTLHLTNTMDIYVLSVVFVGARVK